MFSPDVGQLGSLLSVVGVSRNIIGDPGLALWAVIVAGTWKGYPFYMLMFASALTSVSTDLYDAARVDGAGRLRVFWNIELPAIRPVVGLAAILGFVWIFNWMTPLLVMTEGGPGGATTTVGVYIYQEAIRSFRLANAAVASTVLVGVVLIVFAILFVVRRRAGSRSTGVA
jgi:multiple sugar transport system permease protein